jgi:SAM-dependent methyltransferase
MPTPLLQHQVEIERNKAAWQRKPLLREIYRQFYARIISKIDGTLPGAIIELGSGIGNLKSHLPQAISTDLFPNPWLDLVCDAYELPFKSGSVSHLILFDVFHHLERPFAFFREAERVLVPEGRVILFEPYVSAISSIAYGFFHHEPVGWRAEINMSDSPPEVPRAYYAAQGNATRLFFNTQTHSTNLRVISAERFAAFGYLFSGGFSKPALYPSGVAPVLAGLDGLLSRFPSLFGGRCLIALRKPEQA